MQKHLTENERVMNISGHSCKRCLHEKNGFCAMCEEQIPANPVDWVCEMGYDLKKEEEWVDMKHLFSCPQCKGMKFECHQTVYEKQVCSFDGECYTYGDSEFCEVISTDEVKCLACGYSLSRAEIAELDRG